MRETLKYFQKIVQYSYIKIFPMGKAKYNVQNSEEAAKRKTQDTRSRA